MAGLTTTGSIIGNSIDTEIIHGHPNNGGELVKALSSIQIRNEQYRTLYEEMKQRYAKLTEDCESYKEKLENSAEEYRLMQEKFKNIVDKLQMENRDKSVRIEEMKTKLIDDTKIDQIRDRLSSEIEGPYKSTIHQLNSQLEQTKIDLNKIRHEFNVKTKEFQSELLQKDKIIEEIQHKYDREINSLRKERDLLQQYLRQENQKDSNLEQNRSREIQQFKNKIQQLNEELNQAQQSKLHAEQIASNSQRELLKERSLIKTNLSLIENERDSLKQQLTTIHQELTSINEQLTIKNRQLHERDLRLSQLNSEQENLQHQFKLELANHKIDLAKLKRDHLEEQEKLNLLIQEMEEKLSNLNSDKTKLQLLIQEKEHQILTMIQSNREDDWKKIHEITNEKLDLEAEMNILKKNQDDYQRQFDIERDRFIEQIKQLEKFKDDLTKENFHLNSKLKQINDCQHDFEIEQEKSRELYRKCCKLESQLSSTNGIEQELTEMNFKLKNELNQLINESQSNKQELQQMNNQCSITIENIRRAFLNERKEIEQKNENLIEQLKAARKQNQELQREKNDLKKKYQNYSTKLIEKKQLIDAKLNELKQKELSLQNVVSLQTHNRLKRQLSQLMKKHQQFEMILHHYQITNQQTNENTNEENDLHQMLTRLDRLSDDQHHQLKDFIPVKQSTETILKKEIYSLSPKVKSSTSSSAFSTKDKRIGIQFHDESDENEDKNHYQY